jgi:hypothetical protein
MNVTMVPPDDVHYYEVQLVGAAAPERIRAANWQPVGDDYVFVDRDNKEVRRFTKASVESIKAD